MTTLCLIHAVRRLLIAAAGLLMPLVARAQDFPFSAGTAGDTAAVEKAMPALAAQVIATYKEENPARYFDNLFRLQILAGRYTDALQTLVTLHDLNGNAPSPQTAAYTVQDEIFTTAS